MLENLTKQEILFLLQNLDDRICVTDLGDESYGIFRELEDKGFLIKDVVEGWYKVDQTSLIKDLLILIIDTLLPDE